MPPYRFIGSFSAPLGRRVLESLEKAGIPFEVELENRLAVTEDPLHLGSAVRVFVREDQFASVSQTLSALSLQEGRDFFLLPDLEK